MGDEVEKLRADMEGRAIAQMAAFTAFKLLTLTAISRIVADMPDPLAELAHYRRLTVEKLPAPGVEPVSDAMHGELEWALAKLEAAVRLIAINRQT